VGANAVLTLSFIFYSLAIIAVGLYSTKLKKKTTDDFVLANRELGPWASSLSASASAESGWVMLGLVGAAFTNGLATFWIVPGIAMGYLFNWFVIAERIRKTTTASGAVTIPQFFSDRFGKKSSMIKIIPVIIITLAMLGYVAAQMNAAGKAFNAVFSLPYWLGVIVGACIIMAYTVTGGFRAVCWTDIIQAIFMVIALIGMPILVLIKLGGLATILTQARAIDPNLLTATAGKSGWTMFGFVIGFFGIGFGYPGQPHILARFMAAKDKATIRRGGVIAFVWFLLVYIGAIFFGLFAHVYFGNLADPEQALPLACNHFLPPILGGFVIAAIVAAISSTADSQLIVVSTIISRDVFPFFKKGKSNNFNSTNEMNHTGSPPRISDDFLQTQRLDRWVLVILGVIAVFFALTKNRIIFQFVLYAWSVLGAAFGPPVILGLLWKKTNKTGALAGMITGTVVTIVWRNIPLLKGYIYELIPAFVLSFLAVWIGSLVVTSRGNN